MIKWSASSILRDMQIKITMRYIPAAMATILKKNKNSNIKYH